MGYNLQIKIFNWRILGWLTICWTFTAIFIIHHSPSSARGGTAIRHAVCRETAAIFHIRQRQMCWYFMTVLIDAREIGVCVKQWYHHIIVLLSSTLYPNVGLCFTMTLEFIGGGGFFNVMNKRAEFFGSKYHLLVFAQATQGRCRVPCTCRRTIICNLHLV